MLAVLHSPTFWGWYIFFAGFVVIQAILAWRDGYALPAHLRRRGIVNGWSFLEHGGMWGDVVIISPICAYILTAYTLVLGGPSVVVAVIAIVSAMVLGYLYQQNGRHTPHPHAHDRKTTVAGWVHNLYTVLALFVLLMFYTKQLTPTPATHVAVWLSLILTFFTLLGTAKMSPRWRCTRRQFIQILAEITVLWAITYFTFLI